MADGVKRRMPQGRRQIELTTIVVENPYFNKSHAESRSNPREIPVRLRQDAVQWLHSHGHLDDSQFAVARQLGRLFEVLELAGLRSADPGKVIVDGGRLNGGIGDKQIRAGRELAEVREMLGMRQYGLVRS